ncbi:cytochrome P450 2F5-like [Babylonia areolata]|uniref:cytochrome P450 2F5-like n=1 Tax=Babylonia areolata TaxID=304850 RepID=UPI003FCF19D6
MADSDRRGEAGSHPLHYPPPPSDGARTHYSKGLSPASGGHSPVPEPNGKSSCVLGSAVSDNKVALSGDDNVARSHTGAPTDAERPSTLDKERATDDAVPVCVEKAPESETSASDDVRQKTGDSALAATDSGSDCCHTSSARKRGLPPGPGGRPLVGALLDWEGPETNLEWTRRYGPLYSVRMGPNQVVYLNTIDLVQQYMERQGDSLLGRPEGPAAIANGLLFGQGERWVENRQAFVRAMWKPSFMQRYEVVILEEVEHIVTQLSGKVGQPVELRQVFLPAVTHRLVTVLLGESVDHDGKDMTAMVEQMTTLADQVDLTSVALTVFLKLKRFRRLIQWVSGRPVPDMFKISEVEKAVIQGWITRRRTVLTQAGQADPNALLDLLLTSPEYVSRGQEFDKELIQSIMDLFNGGVAPTVSVLDFAVLYLLHHPHVQDKVRAEVVQAKAKGHAISWTNLSHFPYTHAFLIETLRLASVTPSSLPHVATEDVVVEDYVIPKGVIVAASIYSLHRDPCFYGDDAEAFRPERHLGEDGRVVEPKSFRPFGVGGRLCLGHHMVLMELFLLLASLLSSFRLRAEDPSHPPAFRTMMRVVRRLEPFACVLERVDTTSTTTTAAATP